MSLLRSLCALSTFLVLIQARRFAGYRHEAFDVQVRQAEPVDVSTLEAPTGVLTVITPSPGASPVEVTSQSQIVTTYIPQFTLCDLPPVGFFPVSRPTTIPSTAPYSNYSMTIPPGNGSCTTIYKTTETMVCATVLSDLITDYTVTKCPQDITFSTQLGYVLATPTATGNSTVRSPTGTYVNSSSLITPGPVIKTLTTYFIAPWQQLVTAGPPEDVDLKVCALLANGTENCIREYQIWKTSLVTVNATSTLSVNFSTTIAGPSQLIVETFIANITKTLVTYSMSTTIEKEYVTESRTTEIASRAVSTGPTVYQTQTVEEASPGIISTITRRITSTVAGGTTTITISKPDSILPALPVGPASILPALPVNPASILPALPVNPASILPALPVNPAPILPAPPAGPAAVPGVPEPKITSYANFASMLGADGYRQ